MAHALLEAFPANYVHDGSKIGNDFIRDATKYRITRSVNYAVPHIKQHREIRWLEVIRDDTVFNFYAFHFPNGDKEQRRVMAEYFVSTFGHHRDPSIAAGDTNNVSDYDGSVRRILAEAGWADSRSQANNLTNAKVNEYVDHTPERSGAWLTDVFTRNGAVVESVELVPIPRKILNHHALKAYITIGDQQ